MLQIEAQNLTSWFWYIAILPAFFPKLWLWECCGKFFIKWFFLLLHCINIFENYTAKCKIKNLQNRDFSFVYILLGLLNRNVNWLNSHFLYSHFWLEIINAKNQNTRNDKILPKICIHSLWFSILNSGRVYDHTYMFYVLISL